MIQVKYHVIAVENREEYIVACIETQPVKSPLYCTLKSKLLFCILTDPHYVQFFRFFLEHSVLPPTVLPYMVPMSYMHCPIQILHLVKEDELSDQELVSAVEVSYWKRKSWIDAFLTLLV